MIEFNHTSERTGVIYFENEKGEVVKTYSLKELEDFTGREDAKTYLDDYANFLEATKAFYIDRNPLEFKSANRVQQTVKQVR